MKLKTDQKDFYKRAEVGSNLFLTNAFGGPYWFGEGDGYVEWDLTNPDKPKLTVECHKEPENTYEARGFPMMVRGTAFGKIYDAYGYTSKQLQAHDSKKRGTDGQEAPWFDLNQVTKLVQYPVAIKDIPETVVYSKCSIPTDMRMNNLVDSYVHTRGKGDMNEDIWPPFSKHLNLQVQMDHGATFGEDRHAWGMSGGKIVGQETIEGQLYRYAHKQETLGNNNFPFISFCGWDGSKNVPVPEIPLSAMWAWLIENWGRVLTEAKAAEVSFGNVTQESLLSSYCDGIHVGNEILGGAVGTIKYDRLDIAVGSGSAGIDAPAKPTNKSSHDSTKTEEPAATAAPQAGEKAREKQSKVEARSNPCAACSGGNSVDVGIGKEEVVPGTEGYKGDFTFDDNGKVATVSNRWAKGVGDCLCVKGVASGKTVLRWGDGNSVEVNVG